MSIAGGYSGGDEDGETRYGLCGRGNSGEDPGRPSISEVSATGDSLSLESGDEDVASEW